MQAVPQWQYANGGQFCGMPVQNGGMTPCNQMQGNMNNDGSMQMGMMQQSQQHPQQMAMPVNMQQHNSFGMPQNMQGQGAPFPMPLSPPHDLAQTSFPSGTQPAYYENGGMQLVSVPVGSCPQ
jgi:hypothetical protein